MYFFAISPYDFVLPNLIFDNSFDLLECDVDKNDKNEVLNLDSEVESGLTRRRSVSYSEDSVGKKQVLDDKKSNSCS